MNMKMEIWNENENENEKGNENGNEIFQTQKNG